MKQSFSYFIMLLNFSSHFAQGALSWVLFHGQNRAQELESLGSVDIVLTTYATLSADHTGRGLLHQMEWFRVVLDEGGYLGLFMTLQNWFQ